MTTASPIETPDQEQAERLAFKPADAATALGISRARVFELMREGSLKSVRYGRTRLIPRKAIDSFLEVDEAA